MSNTRTEIDSRIVDVIRDHLRIDVEYPDTDLLETGLLDSLALVMLIAALEESFACELPLDDFDLEHFRSARRITEFLDSSGVLEARGGLASSPSDTAAPRTRPTSAGEEGS